MTSIAKRMKKVCTALLGAITSAVPSGSPSRPRRPRRRVSESSAGSTRCATIAPVVAFRSENVCVGWLTSGARKPTRMPTPGRGGTRYLWLQAAAQELSWYGGPGVPVNETDVLVPEGDEYVRRLARCCASRHISPYRRLDRDTALKPTSAHRLHAPCARSSFMDSMTSKENRNRSARSPRWMMRRSSAFPRNSEASPGTAAVPGRTRSPARTSRQRPQDPVPSRESRSRAAFP